MIAIGFHQLLVIIDLMATYSNFRDDLSSRAIHGYCPLARDPMSPVGLRFAVPGRDRPEDCISNIDELPDGEITLRVFDNDVEATAYCAALSEHGGNAVSAIVDGEVTHRAVLILRNDRSRPPGAVTLEDAILLKEGITGKALGTPGVRMAALREKFAASRNWAEERASRDDALANWNKRWSREITALKAMSSCEISSLFNKIPDYLPFNWKKPGEMSGTEYRLTKTDEGLSISKGYLKSHLSEDLEDILASFRNQNALFDVEGRLHVKVSNLTQATIEKALAAFAADDGLRRRLENRELGRTMVSEASADPRLLKILKRTAEGCLPTAISTGEPGLQLSPRSGTAQTVPGSLIHKACQDGWLRVVWSPRGYRGDRTLFSRTAVFARAPTFYGLTPAGRHLVAGNKAEAAETVVACLEDYKNSRNKEVTYPCLGEALISACGPLTSPELSALVEAKLPADDLNDKSVSWRVNEFWGLVAAGFLTGAIVHDDDPERMAKASSLASAPSGP